jgi:hypothetical protein
MEKFHIVAAIVLWNAVYLEQAVAAIRPSGRGCRLAGNHSPTFSIFLSLISKRFRL